MLNLLLQLSWLLLIYLFRALKRTDSYLPQSLLLVTPVIKSEKKEKHMLFAWYLSSLLFLTTPMEKADVGSVPLWMDAILVVLDVRVSKEFCSNGIKTINFRRIQSPVEQYQVCYRCKMASFETKSENYPSSKYVITGLLTILIGNHTYVWWSNSNVLGDCMY